MSWKKIKHEINIIARNYTTSVTYRLYINEKLMFILLWW